MANISSILLTALASSVTTSTLVAALAYVFKELIAKILLANYENKIKHEMQIELDRIRHELELERMRYKQNLEKSEKQDLEITISRDELINKFRINATNLEKILIHHPTSSQKQSLHKELEEIENTICEYKCNARIHTREATEAISNIDNLITDTIVRDSEFWHRLIEKLVDTTKTTQRRVA